MAASVLVSLTNLATGTAFKLSADKIVQFTATGSDTILTYVDLSDHVTNLTVDETVSTINAAALNTIPVTLTDAAGTVVYINANLIDTVATQGSGAKIVFDAKQVSFNSIIVTETPAAIQTAVGDLNTDITFDDITVLDPIAYSSATGITAFAGGGQASATALTEEFNNVTTVATAGDSVKLPAATTGFSITVKNSGAAALDVFPASGDSINALAINLAVRIAPGSMVTFKAISAVVWESSTDETLTITAPSTVSGGLVLKAANSAGNFTTTVVNASMAASRIITIPDPGADANLVQTEGAQTINGVKTFGDDISLVKEENRIISVAATTTAATAGGSLTINAAASGTSGTGGALNVNGGAGGTTGTGGQVSIASGAGGSTSGGSGDAIFKTANETGTDATGQVNIESGDTASADSGALYVRSGAVSTLGTSGQVNILTGENGASGDSGILLAKTGDVVTGDSGVAQLVTGDVSTLGASGLVRIKTGISTTSGDTGNVEIVTGEATIGGTGDITLTTGDTASGLAGDIILTTGTGDSATVCPIISLNKGVVRKPLSSTIATGATATGVELVQGLLTITGATGNVTLPTAAQITTAIGSTPAGTNFEFIVNAEGMTATNTVTIVVGTDMTVMSAPPITGGGTLTVTQDTQVVGLFRIFYDTATTCKISRIA